MSTNGKPHGGSSAADSVHYRDDSFADLVRYRVPDCDLRKVIIPFPQPSLVRRLRRHLDATISASEALAIAGILFIVRKVLR